MHFAVLIEILLVLLASPVLILGSPKGLLRVTWYSILHKKCQNALLVGVFEKGR